jgi:hypothetical protein
VFVGKADGDHALELVHFIDPPSPGATWTDTGRVRPTSAST